jgi:putative spermidine/putrescine transport system permease protein
MSTNTTSGFTVHNTITATPKLHLFLLLCPAFTLIVFLFGGGLIIGILQALGYQPLTGLSNLTTQHFTAILTDPDFRTSIGLTFYIALSSTLIAAIISICLALSIHRWATNNSTIHFILQIPLAAPHLVIGIAMIFLIAPSGLVARIFSQLFGFEMQSGFPILVNDRWSVGIILVYIWKEIPFITLMLLSVLKNMGDELLEVGATLKATPFQRFRFITLPIIRPSLNASCCIVFAFTFGAFEIPYLLGQTYPLTLPVWAYKNYSDIDLLARPEGIGIGLIIATIVIFSVLLANLLLSHSSEKR